MSLDGIVAGPSQSLDEPLGIGGMRLHQWAFPLAVWRAMHGLPGREVNDSTPVVEESLANIGATLMGRNMFGGHPGPWDPKEPWDGWWGVNPPSHHSVFVLTHHARAPLELEGGTTFTFVTDGIKAALERARRTAGGKDVSLATFTLVHVLLSLIGIASGFVVMSGLLSVSRLGLNGRVRACV